MKSRVVRFRTHSARSWPTSRFSSYSCGFGGPDDDVLIPSRSSHRVIRGEQTIGFSDDSLQLPRGGARSWEEIPLWEINIASRGRSPQNVRRRAPEAPPSGAAQLLVRRRQRALTAGVDKIITPPPGLVTAG